MRPRYYAPPESQAPRTVESLSRPQIAARAYAVRAALDVLACQSDVDGAGLFPCVGPMKGDLIALENRLRELDKAAPARPFALAVAEPDARQRLSAASAELHEVLTGICADAIRAAQHEELLVNRPEVTPGSRSFAPTAKQLAYYEHLAGSPVFTAEERRRLLEWLAKHGTRQTIKDQIDWLRQQVEARSAPATRMEG